MDEQKLSQLHHDLRGCLFTMTAGVRVLQEGSGLSAPSEPSEREQMLQYMEQSGKQAQMLLGELMEMVRDQDRADASGLGGVGQQVE